YDSGVIFKPPGRSLVQPLMRSGETSSGMGSSEASVAQSDSCSWQEQSGRRHVVTEHVVPSDEWMLHPKVVLKIWEFFGRAEIDLFASEDNSHCPTFFSKEVDALAHTWPSTLLYAFPPIALIPQVIRRIREDQHRVLLVAPLWRNQVWSSELFKLSLRAPWPIPLRRDLLSQANRTIWQPQPELWALHLWSLDGSRPASPGMS
ncbi:hypothetical protein ABG768_023338, partial [Culter alburnus]